jgi:hypothetical protein
MIYELQTATVRPGTMPAALERLGQAAPAGPPATNAVACWYSEFGPLNQILTIRPYPSALELAQAREAALRGPALSAISDLLVELRAEAFAPFPFMRELAPGRLGPFYEVRTYTLKPNALARTIELWAAAIEARTELSPLVAVMYSVTGVLPRFVHIWPYGSLDGRQRLRRRAVELGVWPPPGGPDLLVAQEAAVFLPAPFSAMQ